MVLYHSFGCFIFLLILINLDCLIVVYNNRLVFHQIYNYYVLICMNYLVDKLNNINGINYDILYQKKLKC